MSEFLEMFERVNLVDEPAPDPWPARLARERLLGMAAAGRLAGRPVVLLGARVAAATQDPLLTLFPPLSWASGDGYQLARCPHPSGRCRWWNSADNVASAARFWRALVTRQRGVAP